ncbi:MAG: hypothetical protein ABR587_15355 [Candidatus Binatia bacterium]
MRNVASILMLSVALLAAPERAGAYAIDDCHRAISRGMQGVARGRIAQVGRCLKSLNYDACIETDSHTAIHENELRNHVTGAASSCRQALDSGAAVADFGPTSCADLWAGCAAEVPSISTLDDLANCLICHERGFDFAIRAELGMPRPAPADADERRCTRRIARLVSTTVRKSILDAAACARGNVKPFACAVDVTSESRFGAALAKFARAVAACGIDQGKAPGALVNLCGGAATDAASLTDCFTGLAKCLACHSANSALGQSEDCATLSGFAGCDGML